MLRQIRTSASTTLSIAIALLSFALPKFAFSQSSGEQVAAGAATFTRNGGNLTVNTFTPKTIINWNRFGVPAGAVTHFQQPGSKSATLNRVLGSDPSAIYGTLSSNGRLYLINPNGILVGPNGVVRASSFVASTLDVSDAQFLAGGNLVFSGPSTATVVNLGHIWANDGDVFLLARNVENRGTITASGTVGLGAGSEILLAEAGEERLFVRPANGMSSGTGVLNAGTIAAATAELKATGNLYALAINNDGVIRATGGAKVGGRVILRADGGKVESSGIISAQVKDGDKTTGGSVQVLGRAVALTGNAVIDVSGAQGGGTVNIGGSRQGSGPLPNADFTYIGEAVRIDASATGLGDGGTVIVWGNRSASFNGSIYGMGGLMGGDGGFVEISSPGYLWSRGTVNLSAPRGNWGALLYDPAEVRIVGGTGDGDDAGAGTGAIGTNPINYATADPTAAPFIIYESEIEGTNANVTIQATNSISVSGTFGGNELLMMSNRNLTLQIRNDGASGDLAGSIDLTGSTAGSNLLLRTQGTGALTIQASTSGNLTGDLNLCRLQTANRSVSLSTGNGNVSIQNVAAGTGAVTATTSNGDIRRTAGTVAGGTVTLTAGGADGDIGTVATPIQTTATAIAFTGAGTGEVNITESNGATVRGTTGSGPINLITTASNLTQNGNISTTGNVNLTATAGDILRTAGTVTGNTVTLTAGGGDGDIGVAATPIQTSANSIVFTGAGTGEVAITETNGALVNGTTGSGTINLISTTGNWTQDGNISTTGSVTVRASAGALLRTAGVVTGSLGTLTGRDGIDLDTSLAQLAAATTNAPLTIRETNGLALNAVNAGTGNVTLTLAAGALTDNNGGTLNITGTLATLTAPGGISVDTALAQLTASTNNTALTIRETNGLALNTANAGTGTVTITLAAGALTDNNGAGALNITGGLGALTAPGGLDLDTALTQLTASTTNTALTIREIDNLALNTVNAGTGSVTLTLASGALTDNNGGAVNITGYLATLTAPGGIDVDTAITRLTATTTNTPLTIRETNGLALNEVNAGTGNVTLRLAAGALTDNNGAGTVNIAGNLATLTAPSGINVDTALAQLTATTSNAALTIREADHLALNTVNAGTGTNGNVTITLSSGALTDNNGAAVNITGYLATLTAPGGIDLDTALARLTAATTNTALTIRETNGLALNTVNAGTSDVTIILAAGALTDNNGATLNITGTLATLTAPGGINVDTALAQLTAAAANTALTIRETNGLALNTVNAGTANVTIALTAGALTDNNGADTLNITGTLGTLTAPGGIDIDTALTQLTAATTNTALTLRETNGLALNTVNAGTGNVTLTLAAGALTDNNGATLNITGTLATLTAPGGINVDTALAQLTAATTNTALTIRETNGLALNTVNAGTANVTIALTAGALTDNNGAGTLNITGTLGTLTAPGGIDIDTALTQLTAATTNTSLTVREADSLALNTVNAGTGNVSLTLTAGALTDNNGATVNITGTLATLTAFGGIGDADALETAVATLAFTNTGGGNVQLVDTNAVSVSGSNAGGGLTSLTAGGTGLLTVNAGNLVSNNGNINLSAGDLTLTGTVDAGIGDVTIRTNTARTIGIGATARQMTISGAELQNITAANLTIGGSTNDDVTVNGITAAQSQNIAGIVSILATRPGSGDSVAFSGTGSSFRSLYVQADNAITVSAPMSTTAGGLTFRANGNIALNQNVLTAGFTDLFADTNLNGTGTLSIAAAATLNTNGHDLLLRINDLSLTTGAGDRINTGAGSTTILGSTVNKTFRLGNGGTAADVWIAGAELDELATTNLTIGDATTGAITVDGMAAAQTNQIIGTTRLNGLNVIFSGTASGWTNALVGDARNDILLNTNLSTLSGSIDLYDRAGGLIVNANVGAGGAGSDLTILTTGNFTISDTRTLSAGHDVYLSAGGGNFINLDTTPLTPAVLPGGRFLVYSTDPALNTLGGLTGLPLYGRTYVSNPPGTITQTGNRFVYSITPTLTFTADDLSREYGDISPPLTYSISGLVGSDTLAIAYSGSPALSTLATQSSDAGNYEIGIAQGSALSDIGYNLAFVNGTLDITPATLTVTANNASRVYGDAYPAFSAAYAGFKLSQDSSVLGGTLAFSTPATIGSDVGNYSITPSGLASTNYTFNYVDGNLAVTPASLTVTANNASRVYGDANPAFSAVYAGFKLGQDSSVLGGALTLNTLADINSDVGNYSITPSGLTSTNYAITFVDGVLAVMPLPPEPLVQFDFLNSYDVTDRPRKRAWSGEDKDQTVSNNIQFAPKYIQTGSENE